MEWKRMALAVGCLGLIGATNPQAAGSPYSLVVGDLVSQKIAPGNPCEPDEDVCMDVMIETRLTEVRVLAGNRVGASLRFRHRMHVPYRRGAQLQLAAVVLPPQDGVRLGALIGVVEDGKVCLPDSWFQPGEDLLPIPSGHRVNAVNEVCFFEGRDF